MKLKAVISAVLIGILSVAALGGCDIPDIGTDNLLRPPKTMGDEAEIEQLIADTAKNNYTLKYPKNGNNRSAIIMYDLDGDKTDEAIAFYRSGDDITHIHMLVMFSEGDEWKLSSDNITETTDIDCVDFADINGNSTYEILVGYSTFTTNVNLLSCYSYSDGKTSEIYSRQSYSQFCCGDFNSDGDDEIIILLLYTTENEASASMLDYNEEQNALYEKATVPMDPNVVKYKSVAVSDFDSNTKGIVVDGSFASEELNTQIIYYNKELSLLRNPLHKEKTKSFTQRSSPVISTDADNDSMLEIPSVSKLPHSKSEAAETVADKIDWYSFSPENEITTLKCSMIANYNFSYTIKIPESWISNAVTAIYDNDNNSTEFYEWEKDELGSKLFEIKVFDVSEWDIGKSSDEYTLISRDERYAYTFKNNNTDSQYSLTDDEIKTAFSHFNEAVV